ncbi:MAG: hypothetical protein ACFFCV_01265 [Promethearchaeota archaeon]
MKKIILDNLKATKMNNNFIGALHGIAKYYRYHISQQWLMGATGMAFFINIHQDLCPSGPYVFDYDPFIELARNVGLEIIPLGFLHNTANKSHLEYLESKIKEYLSNKIPLIIQNMDNQIIYGFDESGFLLDPFDPEYPEFFPQRITYSTWNEMGNEFHAMIWAVQKIEPQTPKKVIINALTFAEKSIQGNYSKKPEDSVHYKSGKDAYDSWLRYLQKNDGNNHGHWWNAGVWSECRRHAGLFFRDLIMIEDDHDHSLSSKLFNQFTLIGQKLSEAQEKSLSQERKRWLITEAKVVEIGTIEDLKNLRTSF